MTEDEKQIDINAFRRGVLYGIVAAQKMVIGKLHTEIENESVPYAKEYKECCAFLGIVFIRKFQDFMVDISNKWLEGENE